MSVVTSSFGELDILDSQEAFDGVFGTKPSSDANVNCLGRVK